VSTAVAEPSAAAVPSPLARALGPLGAFAAGAGPTALLGFQNGGYDVDVVSGYTVVVWWLLFAGVVSGLLPTPRPSRAGVVALAALAFTAVWGALSLGWSLSPERGLTEVVRALAVAGSLGLGLAVVAAGHTRFLLGGVLAALTAIVGLGVLSRLQPELIPSAWETGGGVVSNRLSWPLNYWNSLAAAASMAFVLGLGVALRARTPWTSGLSVALLPVVALGLVLTLSRGGIVAAFAGLVVAVVAVAPRLVLLRTLVAPAIGAAVLVAAAYSRSAIPDAVGGAVGQDAGRAVLPLVVLVTLGVGLVQAGWHRADASHWTPRLPRTSRAAGAAVAGGLVLVLLIGFLVGGGPSRTADAWDRFKSSSATEVGTSASRLTEFGGNQRYQVWSGAVDAASTEPLRGIGLGSWESWWNPRRDGTNFVRNAHSQPLEVLAETGVIGFGALLALVLAPLAGGVAVLRRRRRTEADAIVALPLLAAFVVAICVDWTWQVSALPVAAFLVAAPLLGASGPRVPRAAETSLRRRKIVALLAPVALGVVTIAVVVTCAIALIAPSAVDRSSAAAVSGRLDEAARDARVGAEAAPFAVSPLLQRATVLERAGQLASAAAAARQATTREPENWRPWFVLARIEAARNRPDAAVAAFRRARALNPSSTLLVP
jgi:hypothetical protein